MTTEDWNPTYHSDSQLHLRCSFPSFSVAVSRQQVHQALHLVLKMQEQKLQVDN